jgi:hypothetical protein
MGSAPTSAIPRPRVTASRALLELSRGMATPTAALPCTWRATNVARLLWLGLRCGWAFGQWR